MYCYHREGGREVLGDRYPGGKGGGADDRILGIVLYNQQHTLHTVTQSQDKHTLSLGNISCSNINNRTIFGIYLTSGSLSAIIEEVVLI